MIRAFLLVGSCSLFVHAQEPAQDVSRDTCTITMRGRAVDEEGAPLAGACLRVAAGSQQTTAATLESPDVRTTADGVFEISWRQSTEGRWMDAQQCLLTAEGRVVVALMPAGAYHFGIPAEALTEDCGDLVLARAAALTGTVRAANGTPIAGARVMAGDVSQRVWPWVGGHSRGWILLTSARTDAQGAFVLPGAAPHGVGLRVQAEGYHVREIPFAKAGEALAVTLTPGGFVEGKVKSAWGRRGPAWVSIEYEVGDRDSHYEVTKADGSFRISLALPHRYRLQANEPGMVRYTDGVLGVVGDGPQQGVIVPLGPPASEKALSVRVVDAADGRAVEDVTAAAIWADDDTLARSGHDHEFDARAITVRTPGEIRLPGPADGEPESGVVIVKARGYAPRTLGGVEWNDAKPPALEAKLLRGGVLAGVVVAGEGEQPLAGAFVLNAGAEEQGMPWFASARSETRAGQRLTDARGRFRLTGLPAGTHRLVVRHLEHPDSAVAEFEVEAGKERTDLRVVMPRGVRLAGTLTGGAPAKGMFVSIQRAVEEEHRRWEAEMTARRVPLTLAGAFAVAGLAPGKYELHVVSPHRHGLGGEVRLALPPLVVAEEDITRAIDLQSIAPGTIAGRVELTGAPIARERLLVAVFPKTKDRYSRQPIAWSALGEDDAFSLPVGAGTYDVEVIDVATRVPLAWKFGAKVGSGATRTVALAQELAVVRVQIAPAKAGAAIVASTLEVVVDRPLEDFAFGDSPPDSGIGVSLADGPAEVVLVLPARPTILRARSASARMTERWQWEDKPLVEAKVTPEVDEENTVTLTLPARADAGK